MLLAAAQMTTPAVAAVPAAAPGHTFSGAANKATSTLLHVYYAGNGKWRACDVAGCPGANVDWGDDSLTYALVLRETATHDPRLLPVFSALTRTARRYPRPCGRVSSCKVTSDTPAWDAVALADEYQLTKDPAALSKSKAAFKFVAGLHVYSRGACPSILYQKAGGRDTHTKTLESQANVVKAALLLYEATGTTSYLDYAIAGYNAARTHFLDPRMPLYTVYVFDDGRSCRQLPHRFFASVNGDMIWSGVALYRDTGRRSY